MEQQQRIVEMFLWPIWLGMSPDYKRKYARNIWEQMESSVRYSGRSENLRRCFERLRRRVDSQVRTEHSRVVEEFIAGGGDAAILKTMREETSYITLLLRLKNDERKAEFAEKQKERAEEKALDDQLSF